MTNRACTAMLMLALTASNAEGVAVIDVPLPHLATKATVIVVGSLSRAPEAAISVVRSVKGPALETISVGWPADVPLPPSGQNLYGLWFLRNSPGGIEPVPRRNPPLAAEDVFLALAAGPIRPEFAYTDDEPVIDRLVKEIQSALASEQDLADVSPLFVALASVAHPAPGVDIGHAEQMAGSVLLTHAADCAVAALARGFDAAVVENVRKRVSMGAEVPRGLLVALGSVTDPDVVPGLSSIAGLLTEADSLTWQIVDALRRIHTKATLPLLSRYLDSKDPEVQRLAVSGLALYANNYAPGNEGFGVPAAGPLTTEETMVHHPATPAFRRDRSRYVTFWRNWCVIHSCSAQ